MRVLTPRMTALPMPASSTVDGVRRFRWPSEKHLAPRRCGHCNAALIASDVPTPESPLTDVACLYCTRVACELIHDLARRPMTPEEFRALPTIAPGPRTGPSSQHHADVPCPDCKTIWIRPMSARCRSCAAEHRERAALKYRLLAALETGQSFEIDGLCRRFGTTEYGIRHAIRNLQKEGKPVSFRNGTVRLKGVQR